MSVTDLSEARGRLTAGQPLVSERGEAEVILDAGGRVVAMNTTAQWLIARTPALRLAGGRLGAREAADQRVLERLVGAAARGEGGEAVVADDAGEGALVQAERVDGQVRLRLSSLKPRQGSADRFADLFGLTRAEARLAEALLEGCDPGDCASRFGVSKTTIRSQLGALFDKTGRRRQASLLVMLAAVAATPPIAAALMHGAAA